jgi:hypothetical protein
VPPLVAFAVKVIVLPEHIVVDAEKIELAKISSFRLKSFY